MQKTKAILKKAILTVFFSCFMLSGAQAAKPLWTFSPQTPTDITVAKGSLAQVAYTVQNQSSSALNLVMKPIAGVSQSGPCQLPAKGSCTLVLNVNGSSLQGDIVGGPVLCQQSTNLQCYQPSSAHILRVHLSGQPPLSPSSQELALSIRDIGALTGNSRTITLTNNGPVAATGIQVSTSGFPIGTTASNNCPTTLAADDTCEVTIMPGSTASLDSSSNACTEGTEPVPGVVSVTTDNAPQTDIDILVLGYGCIYQSGFIFAVDDSMPTNPRIGGKVVSLEDQQPGFPNGIAWDADSNCTTSCTLQTNAWDFNHGDNLASVPGSTNPQNVGTNGPGNTWQISNILNGNNGNTNVPANYAAAVCIDYVGGAHTDWYLPALCDMGTGENCFVGTQQNIMENLSILLGDPDNNPETSCAIGSACLSGFYWSSTEHSDLPRSRAWSQFFSTNDDSGQAGGRKNFLVGVRCIRDLTI